MLLSLKCSYCDPIRKVQKDKRRYGMQKLTEVPHNADKSLITEAHETDIEKSCSAFRYV